MKKVIKLNESDIRCLVRESLNELSTNASVKKARNILKQFKPELEGPAAHQEFMALINQLAEKNDDFELCTNGVGKSYFLPGCVRMYLANPDNYNPQKMSMVLQYLTENPNPNLNPDFNGANSVDEIINMLGLTDTMKQTSNDGRQYNNLASMADNGKLLHIGNYTICPTFTWDVMYNFLTKRMPNSKSAICYIGNFKSFMSNERCNGTRAIYMCVRDGFENIPNKPGVGGLGQYPWDEFGMSIIAISVPEGGNNCEICCRWNNGVRGQAMPTTFVDGTPVYKRSGMTKATPNASFMSPEQVEKYILNNEAKFEDVFKPFDNETQTFRNDITGKIKHFLYHGSKAVAKDDQDRFFKDHEDIWNNILKNNKLPDNFNWSELLNSYKNYNQSNRDISKFVAECVMRTINQFLQPLE